MLGGVGSLVRRLLSGAGSGLGATLVMTAFMLLARRAGMLSELAPRTITRRASRRLAGGQPDRPTLELATTVNHLGVGAGWGMLHALTVGRLQLGLPARLGLGSLYGLGIWLVSYWALLPRLGLMPAPSRDERLRPQAMLAAHLLYGSTLAALDGSSGHPGSSDRST
jgi:hypothetical protein